MQHVIIWWLGGLILPLSPAFPGGFAPQNPRPQFPWVWVWRDMIQISSSWYPGSVHYFWNCKPNALDSKIFSGLKTQGPGSVYYYWDWKSTDMEVYTTSGTENLGTCKFMLLAIGYWLLANGSWLLAIGHWLLAIGYWLLAKWMGSVGW